MIEQGLHGQLEKLFMARSSSQLELLTHHGDFFSFLNSHKLTLPLSELVTAFTHTSFSHEYDLPHQELSEFFGDAVVQLIVTTEIVRLHPKGKEGELSKLRSLLVGEKTLASVARQLKLEELILVGKGEFKKELHKTDTVLSDTLEALMAKIFLHQGLAEASLFLLKWLPEAIEHPFELSHLHTFDAKSQLQELLLAQYKTLPRYHSTEVPGGFLVEVWFKEELLDQGIFSSKKIGEKQLARQILERKLF